MIENEAKEELLKEMNYIIENTRFGELKVFEKILILFKLDLIQEIPMKLNCLIYQN